MPGPVEWSLTVHDALAEPLAWAVVVAFLAGVVAEMTVRFDEPQQQVPFGQWKFDDLMYLPGTVTLRFFGHEVELLPRILYLNRTEHPWQSGETIVLHPEDKLAEEDTDDEPARE
jgi:hypothetical protein